MESYGTVNINIGPPVLIEEAEDSADKAKWTRAYINNLSDGSFLHVESGGKKDEDGKTVPRSLRHLPYKNSGGSVDLPHLRNALSRLGQPVTGTGENGWMTEALRKRLQAKGRRILKSEQKAVIGEEDSLEEEMDDVRRAFNQVFPVSPVSEMAVPSYRPWPVATYEDFLIVDVRDEYFKVSYSRDGDEFEFTPFSEWEAVEKKEEWVTKETLGRLGGPEAAGPDGKCVCPECGHEVAHKVGKPCDEMKCSECGAEMTRSAKANGKLQSLKERFAGLLEDIAEMAGSRLTKTKKEKEKPESGVKTFTAKDGRTWLLIWTTNAFKDRDGEIFTTKSIEDYVERHAEEENKGEIRFWHIPGSKFADILWQGMSGRFLVEAGPFDDTYIGNTFKDFFLEHGEKHLAIAPLGWGTSHGYEYIKEDREDKVYDWFEKKESSVLPRSAASNLYNPKMEVIRVNEEQKTALNAIGGDELSQKVLEIGEALTKELEPDVAHKAIEEDKPDTEPKADVQPEPASESDKGKEKEPELESEPKAEKAEPEPETEVEVEYMTKEEGAAAFMAIAEVIKEQRDAMVTLAKAFKELSKSDEEKIAAKAESTPKASLLDMIGSVIGLKETRIDGRTKLAKEGPEETEPISESSTGIPLIDKLKEANIRHSRGGNTSER